MRLTARRPTIALMLTLCALVTAAVLASPAAVATAGKPALATKTSTKSTASSTPTTSACPVVSPPSPVDTSEQPAPGQASPTPLPEPATPIGGARMGECGTVLPAGAPALPTDLAFDSWVISDLDTGSVLAAKDPHARERPASLAKLLLSLVVVRELDPNALITATQDDANQEGTRVGIVPGVQYTVAQLVHALLMHSGNDVAHALAVRLGGVTTTVSKMNALAKQLGALDTRVATPSGLDGPGMSTSAYDLTVVFRTALKNQLIADSVSTNQITLPSSAGKQDLVVTNDNPLLTAYPGDLGGKTGYTDDAQETYADAAQRGGHRIALIMMRGPHLAIEHKNATELLDYGFTLESLHTPAVGEVIDSSSVMGASSSAPVNLQGNAATSGGPGVATAGDPPSIAMSPFGTVGMPLTILAGVGLLVAAMLYWRRRRAKLARLARATAETVIIDKIDPKLDA